jgi:anti-sigma B factor antagonist
VDDLREPFEFRLSCAEVGTGAYVLTITGELDLHNAAKVDSELEEIVDGGARHVIVDLLEVPFLESTVLGILLRHVRRLRGQGGELTIVTDDVRISRVFEITGLQSHFGFERSLGSAIENALDGVLR